MRSSPRRWTSPGAKRWCCWAPPDAARPPCCASSPGLNYRIVGGRVLFDGKDMTSVPIEQRNVGMVFQSYALFPNMSVADNIGYGLKIRGIGKQERASRIAELVAADQYQRA